MKRVLSVTALLVLAFAGPAPCSAQDVGSFELSIRYYDKAIYFPDSTVQIKLEFYNDTASPVRFKLAENHFYSTDFDVRSLSNVPAERSRSFIVARGDDSPVYYREITLQPGERFGFVEELTDFVELPDPGVYLVRGLFYPELYKSEESVSITSNALTLTIRPGSEEVGDEVTLDVETGTILSRAALPPDEVVSFMLRARQRSEWEKFFLYIDLETLYLVTTENAEQYRRLSDREQRREIQRFRDRLEGSRTEDEILLIPSSFEIVKTSYTPSEATVIVMERFRHTGFTEVKEYTYYLSRTDRVWTVYDYSVKNLGTE